MNEIYKAGIVIRRFLFGYTGIFSWSNLHFIVRLNIVDLMHFLGNRCLLGAYYNDLPQNEDVDIWEVGQDPISGC